MIKYSRESESERAEALQLGDRDAHPAVVGAHLGDIGVVVAQWEPLILDRDLTARVEREIDQGRRKLHSSSDADTQAAKLGAKGDLGVGIANRDLHSSGATRHLRTNERTSKRQ